MLVFCLPESISSSFICTKCYCYLWWRYLWNWACFNKVIMLWNPSLVLQNAQTYWYDQWIKSHKIMPKSIHSYSVSCLNAAVIFDIGGQRTMLVPPMNFVLVSFASAQVNRKTPPVFYRGSDINLSYLVSNDHIIFFTQLLQTDLEKIKCMVWS